MGGSSSGRYRTRNRGAVEHALRLDLRRLKRLGWVKPGSRVSGGLNWTVNDRPHSSIHLVVDLTNPDAGFAKLNFSSDGEPREQVIRIESAPCRFGGRRFYFCCPRTFDRCVALFGRGGYFASRDYHRLTYHSQSEDPLARLCRQRVKAEARALGKDGHPRPRGANRERLVERWIAYEEAADDMLAVHFMRRFGRYGLDL